MARAIFDPNNRFSPLLVEGVKASRTGKSKRKKSETPVESRVASPSVGSFSGKAFRPIMTPPLTPYVVASPTFTPLVVAPQAVKAELSDASMQTVAVSTRTMGTQTDEIAAVAVATAKPVIDTIAASKPIVVEEYPLDDLDIAVVDVSERADSTLAESEPYAADAGDKVRNPDSWVTSTLKNALNGVSDAVYWKARSIGKYVQTSVFGQTEYELLMALNDPNQQVRVWKSWTSLGNDMPREQLYGLSNGLIRSVIIDPLLGLWNEGIKRTGAFNTLEILKAVPDILYGELSRLSVVIESELEPTIRKAVTVLKDANYSNIHYLQQLEQELHDAVNMLDFQTSKLVVSGLDNVEGMHEAISKRLKTLKAEGFPILTPEMDRRYKVSFLDKKRDEAFKFGSDLAKKVSLIRSEVKTAMRDLPTDTASDRKRRINILTEKILDFRRFSRELLDLNKTFVADFQDAVKRKDTRAIIT